MRQYFAFSCLILTCALSVTPASAQSKPSVPANGSSLQAASWGFECVLDTACGAGTGTWITTESQPGTVRLWDSGTNWAMLETSSGVYDWTNLDIWLDLIAEHQPRTAIYTFGHVPCWISTKSCNGNGWGSGDNWSPSPPADLTSGGSPSFTEFVRQLTRHCSPAGHCVKDYVTLWEMWNEANLPAYWTGTQLQLYQMFQAVTPIIRANVPGAIVSTPPVCGGNTSWMAGWLNLENTRGKLSNYYGFHVYIQNYLPETRLKMVERMVTTKNQNGWTSVPWMNTETNFINTTDTCSAEYTAAECHAMLVRWHILQYAYQGGPGGAALVAWYNWELNIASGGYDTYYYTMMQWLTGATFSVSCSNADNGPVYTCPLTESDGTSALLVWNTEGNSNYSPAPEYVNYKEFNGTYGGATVDISKGETVTIGVAPIMFEASAK